MTQLTFRSATKRYWRILTPFMLIFLVIMIGGSGYLATQEVEPVWTRAMIAIGCAIPVAVCMFALIRYVFETDEYYRMVYFKSIAISSGVTVTAIFLFGFLQMFRVIDRVEVFLFGPAFFSAQALAIPLFARRPPK
ncbi:MAG: hypothetical protein AAF642_15760 [Pseudomonadota bacterium]